MNMLSPGALTDMILVDAANFIGNDPCRFGADRHALEAIRNNDNFRNVVLEEIKAAPDEYAESCVWQESAANFVWSMYKKWAYGDE